MLTPILGFLGGVLVALLPRLPAFSVEGRRITRIKQMSDLYESLPASDGKDLLALLVRGETVNLVRFLLLAEQRARSRRRAVTIIVGLVLVGAGVAAVAWDLAAGADTPVSQAFVSISAAVLGALVALGGSLLSAFRLSRASRDLKFGEELRVAEEAYRAQAEE